MKKFGVKKWDIIILSALLCIAALFFAPFPLLKQVSVFLMAGLATAYLSVVALYPMIPMPLQKNSSSAKKLFVPKIPGKVTALIPLILVLFSLLVIVKNYRSFVICTVFIHKILFIG